MSGPCTVCQYIGNVAEIISHSAVFVGVTVWLFAVSLRACTHLHQLLLKHYIVFTQRGRARGVYVESHSLAWVFRLTSWPIIKWVQEPEDLLMDRWPIKLSSLRAPERESPVLLVFFSSVLPLPAPFLFRSFPEWVTGKGQAAPGSAVTWSAAKAWASCQIQNHSQKIWGCLSGALHQIHVSPCFRNSVIYANAVMSLRLWWYRLKSNLQRLSLGLNEVRGAVFWAG